jgi:uncharacterized membrane protein YphA (DoxX/SURF4 family)
MKYIRIICRILLGLVFVFSGFVKGVDPIGGAIKFGEYFEVLHLTWLGPVALGLSILLSSAEFLIGIALVIGLRMKVTSWASLIFMTFFTFLTLYSAIFNPVSDCGCFGDAVKLTNWQTFYKNLVLITLAIGVFLWRKKYEPYAKPWIEWSLVSFFAASSIVLSVYCYQHLPIMDFRPFKVGTHIPSEMLIPSDAEQPVYKVSLFYEKNGVVKEFTMDNFPWQDTTWKFKEQKSELISEGYIPPIHGFTITTNAGEDITDAVLRDTSVTFIFVSPDADNIKAELWSTLNSYSKFASENGKKFYLITGSTQDITQNLKKTHKLNFEFHYTDKTILKTIVRSNPGLMVLKEGVVLGLWHYNDFPNVEYFKGNIPSKLITAYHRDIEWKRILILSLGVLIILTGLIFTKRR